MIEFGPEDRMGRRVLSTPGPLTTTRTVRAALQDDIGSWDADCIELVAKIRAGLVAVAAILLDVIIVVGVLANFKATLTLPGVAALVLTIGMAVDANILIFERIRESICGVMRISAAA